MPSNDSASERAPFDASDYRWITAQESARLATVARLGDMGAAVTTCPGWSLGDLVDHMSSVQERVTQLLETGEPPQGSAERPGGAEPIAHFETCTQGLLDVLDTIDPDAEVISYEPSNQTARFWFRRMALEAAVHRWDAEAAVSPSPAPLDARVAADTIDELFGVFVARDVRQAAAENAPLPVDPSVKDAAGRSDLHIHCTDTTGEWTIDMRDGEFVMDRSHGKAAVALRGPASQLALHLYGRVESSGIDRFGDETVADNWMSAISR